MGRERTGGKGRRGEERRVGDRGRPPSRKFLDPPLTTSAGRATADGVQGREFASYDAVLRDIADKQLLDISVIRHRLAQMAGREQMRNLAAVSSPPAAHQSFSGRRCRVRGGQAAHDECVVCDDAGGVDGNGVQLTVGERHDEVLCIATCDMSMSGWLGSRVVSVLDPGAEGPRFKSHSRCCWITVLGKLFIPIVPLFTKQQNW